MRAVDKGRPPLRATTRIVINVVDLPSSSDSVPHFVSNFSAPVRLMENDDVGHMVCIVAATAADGHKLWYYITGELRTVIQCVPICGFYAQTSVFSSIC